MLAPTPVASTRIQPPRYGILSTNCVPLPIANGLLSFGNQKPQQSAVSVLFPGDPEYDSVTAVPLVICTDGVFDAKLVLADRPQPHDVLLENAPAPESVTEHELDADVVH